MYSRIVPVVGLEVHLQLNCQHKLFSPARTGQAAWPSIAPFDYGIPGSLPRLNQEALQQAIKACLLLGCTRMASKCLFDRKHYLAADLPAGYQITQYRMPLGMNGALRVKNSEQALKDFTKAIPVFSQNDALSSKTNQQPLINSSVNEQLHPYSIWPIKQVQLEQDTAAAISNTQLDQETVMLDYSRSGNALVEVVFDRMLLLHSKQLMAAMDVLHSNMTLNSLLRDVGIHGGAMRIDLNVSLARLSMASDSKTGCTDDEDLSSQQDSDGNGLVSDDSLLYKSIPMPSHPIALDSFSSMLQERGIHLKYEPLTQRTEVKNIRGIRSLGEAFDFEVKRHHELLSDYSRAINGCHNNNEMDDLNVSLQPIQTLKRPIDMPAETRHYDEDAKRTVFLRPKESSPDYCFLPENDVPVVDITQSTLNDLANQLLPSMDVLLEQLVHDNGIPLHIANRLLRHKGAYQLYMNIMNHLSTEVPSQRTDDAVFVANWIVNELIGRLGGNDDCLVAQMSLVQQHSQSDHSANVSCKGMNSDTQLSSNSIYSDDSQQTNVYSDSALQRPSDQQLAELVALIRQDKLTVKAAKTVLRVMIERHQDNHNNTVNTAVQINSNDKFIAKSLSVDAKSIASELGLLIEASVSAEDISRVVEQFIRENPNKPIHHLIKQTKGLYQPSLLVAEYNKQTMTNHTRSV